jgi:photosystem II stability/assembly factor-like uncharacterized protein
MKRLIFILAVLVLVSGFKLSAAGEPVKAGPHVFGELRARSIGPAAMSGRISAVDVVADNPNIFYVGAAAGGVWKTLNGGATFKPVFDKHIQSIGAITIDQAQPKTIWVGTGECWVRNSVSVGDGIYKSIDGGDNWMFTGLKESERIAKIIVHPKDSDTVYVAAMGQLWHANPERGVYKTVDGGKTWARILFVDNNTGCADMAMDPENPDILYAGMWQYRRWPWFFKSGGPGSGLFRSLDGGKNWKKIHRGLPAGELGRIGLATCITKPERVYCVVEAEKTALFRSDNRGDSWTRINDSKDVADRPFYYSVLKVDPNDHLKIYALGFNLKISKDGGESFETRGGAHSDYHTLWINPQNTRHLLLGTDGGVYTSNDGGDHWNIFRNLPVSQFYHVSYDMQDPYHVYGGLQDNGSWGGPSRGIFGVTNNDWYSVGFSDGFYVWVDPGDPDTIYSEFFGGRILRVKRGTFEIKEIQPFPKKGEPEYRFNWNAPIAVTKNALYIGGQFLFRSTDRGESWQKISPDLTTNDPAKQKQGLTGGLTIDNSTAENHCTIFAVEISPINEQIIWAGTDDGNICLTRNGGKTWTHLVKNIPGLPRNTWCSYIEASPFSESTAFAVFDGHRTGDMNTYVYRTDDFGKTWTSLTDNNLKGYAHVICQDPVKKKLLYLGTEFGLFISIDGGGQWTAFKGGIPGVPVMDLALHPRESDLIIATHGRGIYIIDDLEILRQITPDILDQNVYVFQPGKVIHRSLKGYWRNTHGGEFIGDNPLEVGMVYYYLKRRPLFGKIRVEIYDSQGKMVKSLPGSGQRGLNRVEWFLRLKPPKPPKIKSQALLDIPSLGPLAPEGAYTVKLVMGKKSWETEIELTYPDNYPHSAESRKMKERTIWKLYNLQNELGYLDHVATHIKDKAGDLLKNKKLKSSLKRNLKSLIRELEALRQSIVVERDIQGLSIDQKLRERIVWHYMMVELYAGRPSQTQLDRTEKMAGEVRDAENRLSRIKSRWLDKINAELKKLEIELIVIPSEEEFQKIQ